MFKRLGCLLALVCGVLAGCSTEEAPSSPKKFVFTAIPDADETKLKERFAPMAEYLSAELGMTCEYKPVADYGLAVEAMVKGDVFLAWFGGLTGCQARARTEGQAIAQGDEDRAFYSYIIAHDSTKLERSDEFPMGIKGRSLAFGSESSTSGRLMPEFFIRKHLGEAPKDAFSKVGFQGTHDNTIRAVASGSFEIGCVNGKTWDAREKEGKTNGARVIWRTPAYVDYNWSVRGDLDKVYGEGFTEKVKNALLALDPAKPEHKKILDAFPRARFIPAKNDDYQSILDTAKSLKLIRS